jgi:hypothetical protein
MRSPRSVLGLALAIAGTAAFGRSAEPPVIEAILAEGLEPVTGIRPAAGDWVERPGGARQCLLRPREEISLIIRLEPDDSEVGITIAVENRSGAVWRDVRAVLRQDIVDPAPYQEIELGDRNLCYAAATADGSSFLFMAWRADRPSHRPPPPGNPGLRLRVQVAGSLAPGETAILRGTAGVFRGTREDLRARLRKLTAREPPVDRDRRPFILKRGTIDLDLVETTPVVWKGRVLRFEWVRAGSWNNALKRDHFRSVDRATGKAGEPFALDHQFASAFVDGGRVYVTGTTEKRNEIHVFASEDLKSWEMWTAVSRPDYGIFNTSIARGAGEYVLMFEIDRPPEEAGVPFTARFATSPDLRRWEITPPDRAYSKDRYTAPHCLRFLDGWFFDFYLEAHQGYEMRVVRSRDLVRWTSSPRNPVLRASPEDKLIANPAITPEQRNRIAAARNLNNSDIDFCEWNGRLIINYSWGNQQGTEFLAEALYEGTEAEFLRGWFAE